MCSTEAKDIIKCPQCGKTNKVNTKGGPLKIGGKVLPGQRCKYCWVSLS